VKLVLSDDAVADLRAIVRYAAGRWGRARARAYLAGLQERLDSLPAFPELGPSVDDVSPGMRRYSYVSHNIFYRVRRGHIRIVRILHKRMRAEDYLR
jgi:toxin ParE1/3/4